MKSLLSDRFSIASRETLPHLNPNQLKYVDLVKKEIGHGFTLAPNSCPCGQGAEGRSVLIAEVDRYGLPLNSVLCTACGTIRIDPYLDDSSLSRFYTEFYQDMYGRSIKTDDYFQRQRMYGKKFFALAQTFLKPGSNILEFGCGAGGALDVFKSHGYRVYGIEYSKKLIEYGKSKGIDNLYYGSLQDFKENINDLKFDLIFSNHVLEHVNKPIDYLRTCLDMLSDRGSIVCSVPDVYDIRNYVFPNSDLKLMLHIAHIYNYSFDCLQIIADALNAKIERIFPDPKIITPTSSMPELWIKIEKRNKAGDTGLSNVQSPASGAVDYLEYFRQTEVNFLNGVNLIPQQNSLIKRVKNKIKQFIPWKR